MKQITLILCTLFVFHLFSCGKKQEVEDYYDTEFEVEGNPEKVAFLMDFYEKYFENLSDPEALTNLVNDKITDKARNMIKRQLGDKDEDVWKFFKPISLDSIPNIEEMEDVFVSLHEEPGVDDKESLNYYDVVVEDLQHKNHTFMFYVIGYNGDFKIDSISNPDYSKEKTEVEQKDTDSQNSPDNNLNKEK